MGDRPLAVAITGGIGAGKSEALRAFARHGVPTRSSDEIVHRLLREDDTVRRAIVDRLGAEVTGPDGEIDRRRVGRRVFADRDALAWLEALLHPRVVADYLAWREALRARADAPPLCATEVPLLYEVGGDERFDVVVVVTAPAHLRDARAGGRIDDRELRLLPDEEKVRRADFAYVNDGSLEELEQWIGRVVEELSPP